MTGCLPELVREMGVFSQREHAVEGADDGPVVWLLVGGFVGLVVVNIGQVVVCKWHS
jgi:hypothetical protein